MKRTFASLSFAVAASAVLGAVLFSAHALPEKFAPKIKKFEVTRKVDNSHSTYWTYTLRVSGDNFNGKCKLDIDGTLFTGRYVHEYASRHVYAVRVNLGSWSRIYLKPKAHQVTVIAPVQTRDGLEEMRSNTVEIVW